MELFPLLGGILVFALGVTVFWGFFFRARCILEDWANENGFKIVERRVRYPALFAGPFKFWSTSRNQVVYRFRLRDGSGNEHSGWARCGSFWGGVLFSDKVEIRWDESERSSTR